VFVWLNPTLRNDCTDLYLKDGGKEESQRLQHMLAMTLVADNWLELALQHLLSTNQLPADLPALRAALNDWKLNSQDMTSAEQSIDKFFSLAKGIMQMVKFLFFLKLSRL
jgi:hypothetical protein